MIQGRMMVSVDTKENQESGGRNNAPARIGTHIDRCRSSMRIKPDAAYISRDDEWIAQASSTEDSPMSNEPPASSSGAGTPSI